MSLSWPCDLVGWTYVRITLVCAAMLVALPAQAAPPPPTVRLIAASTTDPAIDDVIGVHHTAIGQEADRIGRLMVFLPGTTASAQMYSLLIERAASQGYHAIGLAYVNQLAVNAICAGMGANGCHELVRREVILGTDLSTLVDVDFDNSIVNRLNRLLAYLETIAPGEGWDAYRDSGGLTNWDLIVVAGHSQGAGHAAFIAKLVRVERAVLFSGTEPAPWTTSGTFQTPAADIYGFAHLLEPTYTPIQSSWDNIGLPGTPMSVDGVPPPFGGSNQLTTSNTDCTGDPGSNGFYHNCHCVDGWMPPANPDGSPFFQYAWDHLFATVAPLAVPALGGIGGLLVMVGLACSGTIALAAKRR